MSQKITDPVLPECWNDDTRMSVLFAPFRDKKLFYSSWNQKMSFWSNLILNECERCNTMLLSNASICERFKRKGQKPCCIEGVLNELHRIGKLDLLSSYRKKSQSSGTVGWVQWSYDTFLKSPANFGLKYLNYKKQGAQTEFYIVKEVMQTRCESILKIFSDKIEYKLTDSVVNYNDLLNACRDICDNEEECDIILEKLSLDEKIFVQKLDDTLTLVKFLGENEKIKQISDEEIQIHRIKETVRILLERTEKLGQEVDRLTVDAKMHKRNEKKQHALRCLRQRRRLQNRIEKMIGSIDMLDDILERIKHSVSNEMVFKALHSGNEVLRSLTGKLDIEKVHCTMDELAEIIDEQNEIAMEMNSSRMEDFSSEDLEKELDDLLKTDKDSSSIDIADLLSAMEISSPKGKGSPTETWSCSKCEEVEVSDVLNMLPEVPEDSPSIEKSKARQKEAAIEETL